MSIVKRLSGLVMAVIAAITFCSCDKEGTETGSASGIVGTWRVMRLEYSFNGETVGKETITDGEIYQFRKDGKVEIPVEIYKIFLLNIQIMQLLRCPCPDHKPRMTRGFHHPAETFFKNHLHAARSCSRPPKICRLQPSAGSAEALKKSFIRSSTRRGADPARKPVNHI